MRSLAVAVLVAVFGLAGVVVWLAATYRTPEPAGPGTRPGPAAEVDLPTGPGASQAARTASKTRPVYLDPALIEDGRWGPLPRIGAKGRKPRDVYARRFEDPDKRPRIAIIVTGLGLKADLTGAALKGLPGAVTLAFSAYAPGLYSWTEEARAAGHETLVELPMAGRDTAHQDPGPKALRASLSVDTNRERLHWSLSRFAGYVGVIGARRTALVPGTAAFTPVVDDILGRGLIYVQPRPTPATVQPASARTDLAHVDLWLDTKLDPDAIDRRMRLAEALARGRGWVIAAVGAYPMTVNAVRRWALALNKRDLALAPLTAVVPAAKTADR